MCVDMLGLHAMQHMRTWWHSRCFLSLRCACSNRGYHADDTTCWCESTDQLIQHALHAGGDQWPWPLETVGTCQRVPGMVSSGTSSMPAHIAVYWQALHGCSWFEGVRTQPPKPAPTLCCWLCAAVPRLRFSPGTSAAYSTRMMFSASASFCCCCATSAEEAPAGCPCVPSDSGSCCWAAKATAAAAASGPDDADTVSVSKGGRRGSVLRKVCTACRIESCKVW